MFSNVINLPNNEKKDTKQKNKKHKKTALPFFFFSLISKLKAFKRVGPAHRKEKRGGRNPSSSLENKKGRQEQPIL